MESFPGRQDQLTLTKTEKKKILSQGDERTKKRGSKWEAGLRRSMQLHTGDGQDDMGGGWRAVRTWEVRAGRRGREPGITASSSGSAWLEGDFVLRVNKRMGSQKRTQLQHLDLEQTRGLYSQSEHCRDGPRRETYPTQTKGRVAHCTL